MTKDEVLEMIARRREEYERLQNFFMMYDEDEEWREEYFDLQTQRPSYTVVWKYRTEEQVRGRDVLLSLRNARMTWDGLSADIAVELLSPRP